MVRRLHVVRGQLRRHLVVEGVFWVTSALLLAATVSFAVDRMLRLNLSTRAGLLAIAVAAILLLAWQKLVRPLMLPLDDLDLAELLDRRSPGVGQQISNVLQLPELLQHEHYASPSMVRAAVVRCAAELDTVDLRETLNHARRRRLAAAMGLWLLVAAAVYFIFPAASELWARRWFAGSTVRWPQHNYLNVVGLNDDKTVLVPRGEMSLLQFNARPAFSGSSELLVIERARSSRWWSKRPRRRGPSRQSRSP